MKKVKVRRLGLFLLAMMLLIAAGCQSAGGIDFNQTIKNSLAVTASESKSTYEFQLALNEEALAEFSEDEEELELLKLLSRMKLELHETKVQDATRMSMTGSLVLGENQDTKIGFAMQTDENTLVIELDGAKEPFTFDLTGKTMMEQYGLEETEQEEPAVSEEAMTKIGHDMLDIIGEYGINNLPNPKDLKITPGTYPIGGVDTQLMKVEFAMDGEALWAWIRQYVDALIADRDGLETAVKGILELLESQPGLWDAVGEMDPIQDGVLDAPTIDEVAAETADAIAEGLADVKDELDYMEEEDQESLKLIFGEALQLNATVYIDHKLDIRKQQFELSYSPDEQAAEELMLPFTSLSLKTDNEQWNVNGAVAADKPVVTENAQPLEQIEQGYQFISLIEEDSDLYDLLKNKLHITRQTYDSFMYYNEPIVMPGYITVAAVRDIADAFGAEVTYDAKTKQITLYDQPTDTTIVFTSGSDAVKVNGQNEIWPTTVIVIDGTTYVPARRLAETLGAEIEWTELYEDYKTLTIEREL
ncbi:copper amine oxidase N-terminal domain-containing protein [Paenibacillus nanensis]|uniref:Copper amine oxidase N-terminal domain-containing protein n=1 Tax=Paenibacillus nanensis TaxID=393251 RepID=A0A3A1UXU3_9BACL|nr:copper amine oxidase N-terminal domain-containing protein [Paenibacillus nanensis]RIX53045.1 copper amine oxidase N-terminal domain-containing protein [Paenibacillus nanensis]